MQFINVTKPHISWGNNSLGFLEGTLDFSPQPVCLPVVIPNKSGMDNPAKQSSAQLLGRDCLEPYMKYVWEESEAQSQGWLGEKKGPILGVLVEHSTSRNFLLLRRNVKWSDTIKLTILYFDFLCGLFITINLHDRSGGKECPQDNF